MSQARCKNAKKHRYFSTVARVEKRADQFGGDGEDVQDSEEEGDKQDEEEGFLRGQVALALMAPSEVTGLGNESQNPYARVGEEVHRMVGMVGVLCNVIIAELRAYGSQFPSNNPRRVTDRDMVCASCVSYERAHTKGT